MVLGIMKPCASLSSLTVVFDLGSFDLYKAVQALVAGQVHHDSLHVKRQAICIYRGVWGSTMNGKTCETKRGSEGIDFSEFISGV
jgi:hypothetical protein